jgi:acyl-CoA thioester hydrolase
MSLVKIAFPQQSPIFIAYIPLRITDMNYGNHLGNDVMLSIIHDARTQFLSSLGFTELNAGGVGMIMADVMISYKSEGFYGDILKIELFVAEITTRSFDLLYKVTTTRNNISISLAEAKTGMVSYSYDLKKVSSSSEQLMEIFKTKL